MTNIDWSKAPEGATHWYEYNGMFYDFSRGEHANGMLWSNNRKQWVVAGKISDYENLTPRPTTQPAAWNGEGLPPVGVDLQWFSPVYGWIGGKVVAHDGQTIIVRHNDGYKGCYLHNVKPCRTPEQIAAQARAATIKRLASLCPQPRADFTGAVIEALLDAGMIKDDAQ